VQEKQIKKKGFFMSNIKQREKFDEFEMEDEYDFSQAVIQLLTHEKRYKLFKKRASKKAKEITIQKMSEKLLQGYEKLILPDNYEEDKKNLA
jgi:glycosyltransferase involved in cell wall biosynthesis